MRTAAAFVVFVLIGVLAGCGDDEPDPPPSATPIPTPSLTSSPYALDLAFELTLEDVLGFDVSPKWAFQIGEAYCDILNRNGPEFMEEQGIYDMAQIIGATPEESAFISGAAIAAYCPQYIDDLIAPEPTQTPTSVTPT